MAWNALFLSLQLAVVTTFVLLVIGVPFAYKLSKSQSFYKPVIEAIVSLPIVLPPTVLGFYLLITLSPSSSIGAFLENTFGVSFLFSFHGLVLASVVYSLPFMVHPLQAGFMQIPSQVRDFSSLLNLPWYKKVWLIYLPQMKRALITGTVLTFAHTIGEFGVVLMIGGNIPNKTKVVSIAIYDQVEQLNYTQAHWLSAALLGISFTILVFTYALNHKSKHRLWRI